MAGRNLLRQDGVALVTVSAFLSRCACIAPCGRPTNASTSTTPIFGPEAADVTGGTDRSPGVTRADIPFAALALGSWALLLYLGCSLTFYWDEWAFITFDGGLVDYLRPHNEHWSTLPLMLYRATFGIVGLRSYLPYLAEVDLLHILAVAGAYAITRARVGPVVATLVAFPLLLLGSGSQNLFWAFQTGFVASVMFGIWSLFFIERADRRSPVIASALLVGSLMSSGIGLVFLVAAGVRTTVEPSLRRRALAVAPPALVYLVWFALIGHDPGGDANSVVADPHAMQVCCSGTRVLDQCVSRLRSSPRRLHLGAPGVRRTLRRGRSQDRANTPGTTLAGACMPVRDRHDVYAHSARSRAPRRARLRDPGSVRLRRLLLPHAGRRGPASAARLVAAVGASYRHRRGCGTRFRCRLGDRCQRRRLVEGGRRTSVQRGRHPRIRRACNS